MSKCCNCIFTLPGCYNICQAIYLDLPGIANGVHTVNGGHYTFQATAADGVLMIPANVLNESDCAILSIEGYTLEAEGKEYDCIKFKTTYTVQIEAGGFVPPVPIEPVSICDQVRACLESSTPEAPFIQPIYNVFQGDTNYQLGDTYNLSFTGAEVDGDTLFRGFDPFGNDIGGIQGSNVLGTGNTFNSIRGVANTLGNDNSLNTILGQSNVLGNDNAGVFMASNNSTVGDNCNYILIYGNDHTIDSGVNYSAAWGFGHEIQCDNSYVFGRYGVCPQGGIAIGKGTDALNRSNAHELRIDGSLRHAGAYATKPTRFQAGGSHTIPDNVSLYAYDPATVQSGATIFLPANPIEGQTLYIFGGGTITSGNVITGFTLDGNGRTVIGNGASNLKAGKAIELHLINNIWYCIDL